MNENPRLLTDEEIQKIKLSDYPATHKHGLERAIAKAQRTLTLEACTPKTDGDGLALLDSDEQCDWADKFNEVQPGLSAQMQADILNLIEEVAKSQARKQLAAELESYRQALWQNDQNWMRIRDAAANSVRKAKDQEIELLKTRHAKNVKLAVKARDEDWADWIRRFRIHEDYFHHEVPVAALEARSKGETEL